MKSLFSCSISRNLQSIRYLTIHGCGNIVTVIEDEEENNEAPLIRLFPNLETLNWRRLRKLKSFCEWRCTLELPSLKDLYIVDCVSMDKFRSGPLITPNLKTILLKDNYLTVDTDKDVNNVLVRHWIEREVSSHPFL